MNFDLQNDVEFAKYLADEAGEILKDIQQSSDLTGKELGNKGDETANRWLVDTIKKYRPNDGLLSEEEKDNSNRLSKSRVWIIDPLDGTREYSEKRDDWAVHIALAIDGKPAVGAVAEPALKRTSLSEPATILPSANTPPIMVVSRTRPAKEALHVAEKLNAELLPMGSAGAKTMAVVHGTADIYLHSGGQYEWDNCAPAAVALAAGLHCSRLDGSPLLYNNADVYLPDLLICRKELAGKILELLKRM